MHNHVPPDPSQQGAPQDAAPQPYTPPPFDPAAQPYAPPPFGPAAQPYAPPPFDPAAQPYAPQAFGQFPGYPQAPATLPGTNGFAIGALVASICGGLGIGTLLGIGFGIAALVQIRRRPQKGRGLAIAALVISGLTLVATLAIVVVAIRDDARDKAAGIEDVGVTALKTGDCIREFSVTAAIYDLPVVACTQPHQAEVYHVFTFPAGDYPGQATVGTESDSRCSAAFEPYSTPQNDEMDIYYLYPRNSSDWRRDRSVACIAVDPGGTRTASIVK